MERVVLWETFRVWLNFSTKYALENSSVHSVYFYWTLTKYVRWSIVLHLKSNIRSWNRCNFIKIRIIKHHIRLNGKRISSYWPCLGVLSHFSGFAFKGGSFVRAAVRLTNLHLAPGCWISPNFSNNIKYLLCRHVKFIIVDLVPCRCGENHSGVYIPTAVFGVLKPTSGGYTERNCSLWESMLEQVSGRTCGQWRGAHTGAFCLGEAVAYEWAMLKVFHSQWSNSWTTVDYGKILGKTILWNRLVC